jgi:hypothetical protein
VRSVSWTTLNVVFSGSFSEAGLKKFATAALVVVVFSFRLVGGGETVGAVDGVDRLRELSMIRHAPEFEVLDGLVHVRRKEVFGERIAVMKRCGLIRCSSFECCNARSKWET